MKKCPRCNYSNDEFNIVCVGCGSPLDEITDTEHNYVGGPNPYVNVKTNGLAVASLILGILNYVLCCFILSPVALILGIIAKNQINNSAGFQKGDGMAIAGIILGIVGILIIIAFIVIIALNAAIFSQGVEMY